MTLRRRLALRYAAIAAVCLACVLWLIYHEFVAEPRWFEKMGIKEDIGRETGEAIEISIFSGFPILLAFGWWLMRRSLKPLDELAGRVGQFGARDLGERLPRTGNGDEVDHLAAAFNTMAGRLEESFQQIREFTLHASHELKTPLTIMRAQLETSLAQPRTLTEPQRDSLENLLEEVLRLAQIVDGLTLLARADAGAVTLECVAVRLDELFREAVEDAEVLAQSKGVEVRLRDCDTVSVQGDRHRLRQVLLNLVDNAIKYNEPNGWVELNLRHSGSNAEITIANSGQGVPAELQDRIFDRFVRAELSRSREPEGSGLGLAIVKWVVEAHGGTIRLTSVPGQSTTVTVCLPGTKAVS